jgi:heme/copper-type cytochrome/quinol oxidase subunit 2
MRLPGHLPRRVRRHVLFGVQAPQIARPQAGHLPRITAVEIAWTVVPFLIVIGMALPATPYRGRA